MKGSLAILQDRGCGQPINRYAGQGMTHKYRRTSSTLNKKYKNHLKKVANRKRKAERQEMLSIVNRHLKKEVDYS